MHTPSPWTVRKGPYGSLQVGPAELRHPGKEAVALAEHYGRPDPLAQRAADAALIAAAPDMLAALRIADQRIVELCAMVCTLSGNPRKVRADDYAEEIFAAITLATTPAA